MGRHGMHEYPLSHGQRALWHLDQLAPGSQVTTTAQALRVRSELDMDAVAYAVRAIAARHAALRTTILDRDGEPVQRVHPDLSIELSHVDTADWREPELQARLVAAATRPFDLARGPLSRLTVFSRGPQDHIFLLAHYHGITDLWSLALFTQEFGRFYAAYRRGEREELVVAPGMGYEYADFVAEQAEMLAGPEGEEHWTYWLSQLAGDLPVLNLPTDRPRPPVQTYQAASEVLRLNGKEAAALQALAEARGGSLFATVLASFQVLLYRYTGQEDVVVGTLKSGRSRKSAQTMGYFVNPVAIRADLSGEPAFTALMAQTYRLLDEASAHDTFPFPLLVERLQPRRDPSRPPIFQVLFSWQKTPRQLDRRQVGAFSINASGAQMDVGGLLMESMALQTTITQYDLTVLAAEVADGLVITVHYNTDLFEPGTITRLLGHWRTLLASVQADPGWAISRLPILTGAERLWLAERNLAEPAKALPEGADLSDRGLIHRQFESQAATTPQAVALAWEGAPDGEASITYEALDRKANQLAHRLIRLGAGPETPVGIYIERSPEMIVAVLGTLKAGSAYVPLDPSNPAERLRYMLEDSGVSILLSQQALLESLPGPWGQEQSGSQRTVLCLDRDWPSMAGERDSRPDVEIVPENAAYVIYTSGSTGRPKGVVVTHANVTRLFAATQTWFGFGERDVWTLFHSLAFDFSVWEIWGALLHGGTLVIVPYLVSRSPEAFYRLLARHQVTVLNQTPSAFRQLMRAEEVLGMAEGLSLRLVIFGGEALEPASLRPWFERHGDQQPRLVNMYGITETTVHVTYRPLTLDDVAGTASVIGRPIPDLRLAVLDRHGEIVPTGVPGELVVGGAGVARGYWRRPELTAERFVPVDGAYGELSSRMYRSGDLVRWLPDGDLAYLGRIDQQVKIRGFRVELGEIEAVLSSHPGVREAVVVVRQEDGTEGRLVAYVVVGDDEGVGPAELRSFMQASLPEYMVPSVYVTLNRLPLTANGKIDRRALPVPAAGTRQLEQELVLPRTQLEQMLAALWAEELDVPQVGVHDNFFDLGGHSLVATRLVARIREATGMEVSLRALFEHPTVAGVAQVVASGAAVSGPRRREGPRRARSAKGGKGKALAGEGLEGTAVPLSFAQQRLWLVDQMEPGSAVYNIPAAVRLEGALDVEALRQALEAVVTRHAVLRTTFTAVDGVPAQVVQAPRAVELPVLDLQASADPEAEMHRLAQEEARTPFDLARGPVWRCRLLRLAPNHHVLLLTLHHIAADGWSLALLTRELSSLYGHFAAALPLSLPDLPIQYAGFAAWQRAWLHAADDQGSSPFDRQLSFWQQQLAGLPPLLDLPTDRPRPPVKSTNGATLPFHLPGSLVDQLRQLSRQEGATLFMTLLAAFQTLLFRYAGQTDFATGTAVANRPFPEAEPLIGFFANTLPIRADLSGRPSFRQLLQRVRTATLDALAHQDLPFEALVDALDLERSLAYAPIFQVMFSLQDNPARALRLPGVAVHQLPVDTGTARTDLVMLLFDDAPPKGENQDRLVGQLEYSTDLFDAATMTRLVGQYQALLEAIASNPDRAIARLPLLQDAERQCILSEWNDTRRDYPRQATLQALFEAQAARTPDAMALIWDPPHDRMHLPALQDAQVLEKAGDDALAAGLTYGELNRRANQLAHALVDSVGIRRQQERTDASLPAVGVLLERSPEMVVAMLGILKAGAGYVPLDPTYPPERVRFIVRDASLQALMTTQQLASRFGLLGGPDSVPVPALFLDADWERIATEPSHDPPDLATADDLAYVIYTSGSTGVPKGVAVPQRAVVRLVCNTDYISLRPGDRVAQASNASFDAATFEIWGALLNGATLVGIPRETVLSPHNLAPRLRELRITTMFVTTALFNQVAREEPQAFGELRDLLFGGEAADPQMVHAVLAAGRPPRMLHVYGPTEATTFTTWERVQEVPDQAITVPIGLPIANTQVYVLDESQEPVPPGIPGELYIGGDGLALGYLGQPGLTAERFVPNPFAAVAPEGTSRLYRTGDLGKRLADGRIEFLSRLDNQVKLRGFRVEPGEVEACLMQHPEVAQAAVVIERAGATGPRLVACVVARPPDRAAGLSPATLRAYLRSRLPEYMVPAAFAMLDALPLTASGKVDRQALARLAAGLVSTVEPGAELVAPRSPLEELVAQVWQQVLARPAVGIHDDFFALGGNSLVATQVMSRLRTMLGVDLPLRELFEAPTVAGLAGRVSQALAGPDTTSAASPIMPGTEDSSPPLSFAQERLWFLDQMEPGSLAYHVPLMVRLYGDLDVQALARSLDAIIERHAVLRTRLILEHGEPVQVIEPGLALDLPVADLRELAGPGADLEAMAQDLARQEARQPFDLAQGPLLRARLLRLADDEHWLVLVMHHIVCDGWSLGVLVRELTALYTAYTGGEQDPSLPTLPIQYADFARWQRRWLVEGGLEHQLHYWRKQLHGPIAPLELPTDRPRPPVQTHHGARHIFALHENLAQSLKALSQTEGSTLFMTLLAALEVFLLHHTGQTDICVGTPIANRNHQEIEDLIGVFINTLVLRTDLSGDPSFVELLGRVRQTALNAYANQDLPFERLVDALAPERDLSRSPLFQVLFVLQNAPMTPLELPGLTATPAEIDTGTVKFDLTLSMEERDGTLMGSVGYNTDLFDATTIESMFERFCGLLEAIVANPHARLASLSVLTDDDMHSLRMWSQTPVGRGSPLPVHQSFALQAIRTPDALAVLGDGAGLSYAELDKRANQLAHALRAMGAGPEVLVGLHVRRSPLMVAGLLGILKAGGAYLPLDPTYPPERLALMLADSRARIVLTEEALLARLPADHTRDGGGKHALRVVCLDTDWGEMAGLPATAPPELAGLDNLAYVIYTSGSTGRPKGVAVAHRALTNYVAAAQEMFELTERDRVLQFASISFDAAAEEIFPALARGATLVLRSDEMVSSVPAFLAASLRHDICVWDLPTAYWHQVVGEMTRNDLPLPESLRLLIIGGERAAPERLAQWWRLARGRVRLLNTYGPTEATIVATAYEPAGPSSPDMEVPIGRPVLGVEVAVVDEHLNLVPPGVSGELCIGGMGVARGYVGDPCLTALRFVPGSRQLEDRQQASSRRFFRTGDRVRWRTDGQLEFLGRLDQQVKIRGFRVEPGEVEAALVQHPRVVEAAVVAQRDGVSEERLVAYIVPGQQPAPHVGELREFLGGLLPPYMVPAVFVAVDALPLTPSGKLDVRNLPLPDGTRPELARPYESPRNALEEALVAMWQELLGVQQVGVHDSFFELGGDSLRAAVFVNRLQRALDAVIYVVVLFDTATVAELAAYLKEHYGPEVARWTGQAEVSGGIAAPPRRRQPAVAVTASTVIEARGLLATVEPDEKSERAYLGALAGKNPPVAFILSAPRSGSTLLRVMLSGHPRLFAPPELALLSFQTLGARAAQFAVRDAGWLEGTLRAMMELKQCSLDEARRLMATYEADGLTTQALYAILQNWAGGRMLVDKTTLYATSLQTLQRGEAFFAEPRYIHLVRQPAAMIQSYIHSNLDQVFGRGLPYPVRTKAELLWLISNQNIQRFFASLPPERRITVRFEDLVRQPRDVATALCRFLGIEFVPELLEPYAAGRMLDGVHPESRMVGDPRFFEHKGIEAGMADRWPDLPADEPLSRPTLELAQSWGYRITASPPRSLIPVAQPELDTAPLSPGQQRLWFLDQLDPHSYAYNLPGAVRLTGQIDVAALHRALNEIVRRHAVLRTTYENRDGTPVQVVATAASLDLPVIDLSDLPAGPRETEVQRLAAEEAHRPFDLAAGPVVRAQLVRLSDQEHVLLFTMHHIAGDGWSIGVLSRELTALYGARAQAGDGSAALPELALQVADYARWHQQWLNTAGPDGRTPLESQLAYWRAALAGMAPVLALPTDRPRPPLKGAEGATLNFQVPEEVSRRLRQLAQQEDVTPFMGLLAAFEAVLYRYTGQEDFGVGTAIAGRNRQELEPLIGFFVNTLVLRADLAGRPTFRELLARVRRTSVGAYANQDLPFETLVDALQPERSLSHSPLFQVMFVMQEENTAALDLAGLDVTMLEADPGIEPFDLTMALWPSGDGLRGALSFDVALFDRATVERMTGHFLTLLQAAVADPDARVEELPLLAPAERQRSLVVWNATPVDFGEDRCAHELFEAQAARTPDQPAVRFAGQDLSYGELDARSNQLAHYLRRLGVGLERTVAICMQRSVHLAVALHGVHKAGGAYVPLDPGNPTGRLRFMLADAQPAVVITDTTARDAGTLDQALAGMALPVIYLDEEWARIAREPQHRLAVPPLDPQSLAYVIYTSGSTGDPKGVMVSHRSLVNQIRDLVHRLDVGAGDRYLQFANLGFDMAVEEMFPAWASGATVVYRPNHPIGAGEELERLLEAETVTVVELPTAYWHEWVLDLVAGGRSLPQNLRMVVVGGEKIAPERFQIWREHLARAGGGKAVRWLNGYGPTEATVNATFFEPGLEWQQLPGREMPIGRPVANTRVYVLDEALNPVPVGVSGDLYIGGVQVARGYLGQPGLTAAAFVPDPFGQEPGARLYRTGDRARWLPDGTVEFLGRADHQVKVRGFRVEVEEIERQLARHVQVQEAVVQPLERDGQTQLVAYYVAARGATVDPSSLRGFMRERLPDPMVPLVYVPLAALPLSAIGKIDRSAFPAPDMEMRGPGQAYVEPVGETEQLLAALWAELLGVARVGRHDDFFDLGGHSLLATRLVSRIRQSMGVELPLRTLFEQSTVAEMAEAMVSGTRTHEGPRGARSATDAQAEDLAGEEMEGVPVPLSFAQQRLWFLDQLEPGLAAYNMPAAVRLEGALDVEALRQALEAVVTRHTVLRTTFTAVDGVPAQVVQAPRPVELPVVDLQTSADPEVDMQRLAQEEARTPFDLARDLPWRSKLLRLASDHHVLLLTLHHIAADGWSLALLTRELSSLYSHFADGRPLDLPDLPLQYADFAAWQRSWLHAADDQGSSPFDRQLAFWQQQLAGLPPLLDLPTDRPRPPVKSTSGATLPFHLPDSLVDQLRQLSRQEGATLFMTLLAAFQALLFRYAGQTGFATGTAVANRPLPETEPLIGFFANTLPIRADLSGHPSFRQLLQRVRTATLDALAHQDLPFEALVDALDLERDLSYTPLYQVAFSMDEAVPALELPGLVTSLLPLDTGLVTHDLLMLLTEEKGGLAGLLRYDTDLFDSWRVRQLVMHYQGLLKAAVAKPDLPVTRLPLLAAEEAHLLVNQWSGGELVPEKAQCIHETIAAQAATMPDAVAVVFAGGSAQGQIHVTGAERQQERIGGGVLTLTYGELDRRANQLANYLKSLGAGPETIVGLCIERSPEAITGILGILKSGAAYLPLDPTYPQERLRFMIEDSGVGIVLTQERLLGHLPPDFQRLGTPHKAGVSPSPGGTRYAFCLDTGWSSVERHPVAAPAGPATLSNLAYVIYTSGSTGTPKGTMLAHMGLASLVTEQGRAFELGPGRRVLQFSRLSFDASVWEIFMALGHGCTLVLAPQEALLDPGAMVQLLRDEQITTATLPPTLLATLPAELAQDLPELDTVIAAGERCPAGVVRAWTAAIPAGRSRRFFNAYGPTETTVCASLYLCSGHEPGDPPIGRPLQGTRVYVLDAELQPVPVGVPGELCVAGAGVARGYLHRPELTAEHFVPNPFGDPSQEHGSRLYRTGDLVRWLPDGNLEFLGRSDQQVQLRGFRVEPGEVEAVLRQHPALAEAAVIAVGGGERGNGRPQAYRLVAYVVPADGRGELQMLGDFLAQRLPEYMIPATFHRLPALPLTPSGKVDRQALRQMAQEALRPGRTRDAAPARPASPAEQVLAQTWAELLGVERVGRYDNFFELGGDSILAMQAIARARQAGLDLAVKQLFQAPTVAGLAALAMQAQGDGGSRPAAEQGLVEGTAPLTPIQRWFFETAAGNLHHFNQSVLIEASEGVDPAGLRQVLAALLAHHDALRLRFTSTAQGWSQHHGSVGGDVPLVSINLSELSGPELATALDTHAAAAQTSLDIAQGPLLRMVHLQLGEDAGDLLLIAVHHLAMDGVSWRILLEDLQTAYRQAREGSAIALPPKTTPFRTWALRLTEYGQADAVQDELGFWREMGTVASRAEPRSGRAAARDPVRWPLTWDLPGTEADAATYQETLGRDETAALLREVPAAYGADVSEALLTALARAYGKVSGWPGLFVDVEGHGREPLFADVDLTRTVGWFTTQYPVWLAWRDAGSDELAPGGWHPGRALMAVKERMRSVPNRGIGYGVLRYLSGDPEIEQTLAGLPQPAISLNYLGQLGSGREDAGPGPVFRISQRPRVPERDAEMPLPHLLEVSAAIQEGQLWLAWTYDSRRLALADVQHLAQETIRALQELVAHSSTPEAASYTPSDFPQAGLTQDEIDALMEEIGH